MLVLSRKVGEQLMIGDDIVITVVRMSETTVRLGITAPVAMNIVRAELVTQGKDDGELREAE